MPVQDATAAADALQEAIAALGAGHELRPVLGEVRQFVLATATISAGKEALLAQLRAIEEQLAAGAASHREMSATVAHVASALADLQRLEAARGEKLGPLITAIQSRMSWTAWLQSPGRGRELGYLLSVVVLGLAALAGHQPSLSTLASIFGGPRQ